MLQSKPLSEVEYDDLLEFLHEGREEGVRLDYKQEWGSDIAKDTCAMANAQGGTILIGVKERRRACRGKVMEAVTSRTRDGGVMRFPSAGTGRRFPD